MKEQDIDWEHLPFGYMPTDYNVRCRYTDDAWGVIETSSSDIINIHMAATCLHYGQESFEGLKAFRGVDGKIRVFRPWENAKRFRSSAAGIMMPELPDDKFVDMVARVVKLNERFVPPYGTGASLYIRPLQIGMTAQVGVKPAKDYLVVMFTSPVGPYFKTGFGLSNICIAREYDRVAPKGTGRFKIGGNYAASLCAGERAHAQGYSAMLYLDPKDKKYLDECGPANFFAICDGKYITPASDSILPSITNMSLRQLAKDMGLEVEQRHITVAELEHCTEAAACGTAAVCSPVGEVHDLDTGEHYVIAHDGRPGPIVTELYNTLRGIQYGELPDTHHWCLVID